VSASSPRPQWSAPDRGASLGRWFALLGGHLAWSAQLLVGFALAAPACRAGWGPHGLVLGTLSLAALAVTAGAGWAGLRLRRRAGAGAARDRFLGLVGFLLSGLFAFAILLTAAGLVLVGTCR
jgi:hypothetical protein